MPDGRLKMRGCPETASDASLRPTLAPVHFWSSSPDHRAAPGASFIAYAEVSRRLGTGKLTYFTAATNLNKPAGHLHQTLGDSFYTHE